MTLNTDSEEAQYHLMVVVLGDLGRSPRMMYHVLSLLEDGHYVTFVGYQGEPLIPVLQAGHEKFKPEFKDRLRLVRFAAPYLKVLKGNDFSMPFYFLWRIVSLTLLLCYALFIQIGLNNRLPPVDALLLQNPPAVPLLAIAALYSHFFKAALILDWHNLGYSMLPQDATIFRSMAKHYEMMLAPLAHGHLTVTDALKSFLQSDMNISSSNINVMHDCSPTMFRMRTLKEQHAVLTKIDDQLCAACPKSWYASKDASKQTLFTEQAGKTRFYPRKGRPALMVNSTSWTNDEDLQLMIDAVVQLDATIAKTEGCDLKVFCAVTGKGPLKEYYLEQISKLTLEHVVICTLWLEPSDYPAFLACADLGLSVHTSTSKMDLPIKILDYFGCEVPVCAYKFSSLKELVQDDVNGKTFESAGELCTLLFDLLSPLASADPTPANHDFGKLKTFSLQVQGRLLWSENWPRNAKPVIERAIMDCRAASR